MKNNLFVVFFLLSLGIYAQNITEDIKKMTEVYTTAKALNIEMKVKVWSEDYLITDMTARVIKNNQNVVYQYADKEFFLNESGLLMIHNNHQRMIYRSVSKQEYEASMRSLVSMQTDTLLNQGAVVYKGKKDGRKIYEISNPDGLIAATRLVINLDFTIHSIKYIYNQELAGQQAEVVITMNYLDITQDQKYLSSDYYYTKGKEGLIPSMHYQNYTISQLEL